MCCALCKSRRLRSVHRLAQGHNPERVNSAVDDTEAGCLRDGERYLGEVRRDEDEEDVVDEEQTQQQRARLKHTSTP